MKIIIAGSRDVYEPLLKVTYAVQASGFEVTSIISGRARGIDRAGEEYAKIRKIPVDPYPAEWKKYGKAAGFIRNRVMAKKGEGLIAIWDGKSPGTKNMIEEARKEGLDVYICKV